MVITSFFLSLFPVPKCPGNLISCDDERSIRISLAVLLVISELLCIGRSVAHAANYFVMFHVAASRPHLGLHFSDTAIATMIMSKQFQVL